MSASEIILAAVLLQRLGELWYAKANTRRLLDEGGIEHGAAHYPYIVMVHVGWLVALVLTVPAGTPVDWGWLAVYGALQAARAWVMVSLGRSWTTRVITVPGRPLSVAGPYRVLRHPNYIVVAGEILVLPLVFGQIWIALLFSLANAAVMVERIRVENAALAARRDPTPADS